MLIRNLKFYDFSVRTYNKSKNQNFKVRYRNEEKRRFYGKINTIFKPVHQKYYFWKIKMSWRTFSYISDYQEGNKKRVFSRSLLILCNFWIYRENWSPCTTLIISACILRALLFEFSLFIHVRLHFDNWFTNNK